MIPLAPCLSDKKARDFCEAFTSLKPTAPRLVLGTNAYAVSIAENVPVDGFIDEFALDQASFMGRPVYHSLSDVPDDALVVSAVVGRLHTALDKIRSRGLSHLDYFAFARYSGLALLHRWNLDRFPEHFSACRLEYDQLYQRLADDISKATLRDIVNFRLSQDIRHLAKYEDRQRQQYFEDFLGLRRDGETFVDVGGYDGYTSAFFMERCPGFTAVHIFEPERDNSEKIRSRFAGQERVFLHPFGLADTPATLRFSSHGSASRISEQGDHIVQVVRLDDELDAPCTFMKMDIEGAEGSALAGAAASIRAHRPRLAISVYHHHDDLVTLSRQVLDLMPDCRVYLRHYTEGTDETVMFFLPEKP